MIKHNCSTKSTSNFCISFAILASCLLLPNVHASEALARKYDCLGCHAVATKLVGPAYKDVAAKYADQSDAQDMLVTSILQGGVGKWGDLPMPAQNKITPSDVKKLAAWILKTK